MIARGFTGRQQSPDVAKRLPPGQSLTTHFPVLPAPPKHVFAEGEIPVETASQGAIYAGVSLAVIRTERYGG
jgi:hypothetical protein